MNRFFGVLLCLCVAVDVHYCADECGDSAERRIDSVFAKLLTVGGSGRRFPENKKEQLKKYCDDSYRWITEIDKYKVKCMKNASRQITGVMVYSIKNVINQYCKRDTKRLDWHLSGAQCTNHGKKAVDQCYTSLVDQYMGSYNAKDTLRMPHVCCSYQRFLDCIRTKLPRDDVCVGERRESLTTFVKEIFDNTIDLMCGDYTEGSDKCDRLGECLAVSPSADQCCPSPDRSTAQEVEEPEAHQIDNLAIDLNTDVIARILGPLTVANC